MAGLSLFDKIWNSHVIVEGDDGEVLLWVDRHYVHEGSHHGFARLRERELQLAEPGLTIGVMDHYAPTDARGRRNATPQVLQLSSKLRRNASDFGFRLFDQDDPRQGIVHVIGPEQGLTLPGMLVVCGDSHTSTHGALGAFGFGIGASDVAHVLATQTIWQRRPNRMRISFDGSLGMGIGAKDMALHWISKLGADFGRGHAIEYGGPAVRALTVEGRLTLCNMSIEGGAKAGIIAPDDVTFDWLKGRLHPSVDFARAVSHWMELRTDSDAEFETDVTIDASEIAPIVTWGTSPEDALPIDAFVPDPADEADPAHAKRVGEAIDYMGLQAGQRLTTVQVDQVFIGSCTNGRIEDLRAAAAILVGKKAVVPGIVSPGSHLVKQQAEQEGLSRIFEEAGLEWRDSGCSMCVGMNGDIVEPGKRCASTTNRNFRGRQGPGARTHLMSPAMVAAAAITGHLTDVRLIKEGS